jgi:hypothetical protein
VQNETAPEHTPFLHRFEQHCASAVQPLPAVRHPPPGLTEAHLPFVQMPLQQSDASVQAPATGLSGTQGFDAHWLFDPQKPVQQSAPSVHAPPRSLHGPVLVEQTFGVLAPQTPPFGHAPEPTPHATTPPQPSGMNPQFIPAHAFGVFVHWLPPPHWLGAPPPPHTSGEVQVPHARMPPQPSAIGPQAPAGHFVSGTHAPPPSPRITPPPQTFGLPPPPQI